MMILTHNQVLEKIENGEVDFRDKDGNNLLHLLFTQEEQACVPFQIVKMLLQKAPDLVNTPNKKGVLPTQVLDSAQVFAEHISNRPVRRLLLKYVQSPVEKRKLEKSVFLSFWEQYAEDKRHPKENSRRLPLHADLFKKPTILFFSGWGAYNQNFLLGTARSFRKSLKLWHKPTPEFQLLFAQYPGNKEDLENDCSQVLHPKASLIMDHPMQYIRPFVAEYLQPLYLDEKKHKRPLKQILKNIRRVNLVGYSYGASVIQMIADAMKLDMAKHLFTAAEIKKIQSQIPAFLIAPYLNPQHCQNDFQSYYFLNEKDELTNPQLKPILTPAPKSNKAVSWTTLSGRKNQKVLFVDDPDDTFLEKLVKRIKGKNAEIETDIISNHDLRCYFQDDSLYFRLANAWKNRIIFNMLRNTQQNRKSAAFIPLGKLENNKIRGQFSKSR